MNVGKLNFFSVKNMVSPERLKGDLPSSKEAYGAAFNIAFPSFIEMTTQALIGMISMGMVSALGTEAIAAVGIVGQPRMIFMALFSSINVGVTAVIARRRGQEDEISARQCMRTGMLVSLIIGIIMAVVAFLVATPLLLFAGAMDDTIELAVSYFRITAFGLPIMALTTTISASQRGIGNTRVTMLVNISATAVSFIFHFLLINGNFGFPALGVDGAAYAVVIGQCVGLTLALLSILDKRSYLAVKISDNWRFNPQTFLSIIKISGGNLIEQLFLRIGFFSYAIIIARLGTNPLAAHNIAQQMMHMSFTFADGIGVAITALVGRYLGAKRPDLSIMYGKIGQRMALVTSVFLVVFTITGRYWFAARFSEDADIIAMVARLLIILALVMPIQTSQLVMASCLRGAGDTRFVALTMLITVAIARPTAAALFVYVLGLGLEGAWLAIIVDQSMRLILLTLRFSRAKWTKIKV